MSRLPKQQLSGKLAKKTLTLDEKIKFLNLAKKNPKLGCRKLADIYKTGKTAAANILMNLLRIYISVAEYTNFDENVLASEPMINEFKIDWWQRVREGSINTIQNPEVASDQVEEIFDDDGSNDKNDELEQESMGFKEIITMHDKMKRCPVLDDDSQDMLLTITKRVEDLQLKNWKQSSIKAYFNKSL